MTISSNGTKIQMKEKLEEKTENNFQLFDIKFNLFNLSV